MTDHERGGLTGSPYDRSLPTARGLTAIMRTLHPAPVRLSVHFVPDYRVYPPLPGTARFLLRLPRAAASTAPHGALAPWPWLASYIERRLDGRADVKVTRSRTVKRRDGGTDTEFAIRITERS